MPEQEDFDLSAAGLRADGTDLKISLQVLASKLEQSLPQCTRVERHGGGLLGRGEKQIRRVQVEIGGCCFQLAVTDGRLEGFRERQVGGISIKRESLDPQTWVSELTAQLQAEAQRSAQARTALEGLLG
ncbi:MAG TPA: hypothetical protein VID48_10250 [Solirubrobacteraceae bacterium]|jgi:hypothetical protein